MVAVSRNLNPSQGLDQVTPEYGKIARLEGAALSDKRHQMPHDGKTLKSAFTKDE
jgi:hypothetical protein